MKSNTTIIFCKKEMFDNLKSYLMLHLRLA